MPYHLQGHNFTGSAENIRNGWLFIRDQLNLKLLDAWVLASEVGEIFQVTFKPQASSATHTGIKGMNFQSLDFGRTFESSLLKVKIYDAGKRLKQLLTLEARNELQKDHDYNPNLNYIRVENHYKKPEIYFKKGPIPLTDLFGDNIEKECKLDLIKTYKSTIKIPEINILHTIKNLSTSKIFY